MINVYYAHSMCIYNTKQEKNERTFLESFKELNIVCPNRDLSWSHKSDMELYLQSVKSLDLLIFSRFLDYVGKGVYTEIHEARAHDIPVILLEDYKFYMADELRLYNTWEWKISYGKIDPIHSINIRDIIDNKIKLKCL